jgi:hypothetical protein
VNLGFLALLLMLAGQVVAWRWEGAGGLMILGGLAGFALVNHGFRFNVVFGAMLVTGLLYAFCGWASRRRSHSCAKPSA